jgi:hypothetical protein
VVTFFGRLRREKRRCIKIDVVGMGCQGEKCKELPGCAYCNCMSVCVAVENTNEMNQQAIVCCTPK